MQALEIPKTLKIYTLIKQTGINFSMVKTMSSNSIGIGFFLTREEAEHNRTLEILADSGSINKSFWHVFELEIPNPVYQE